MLDKLGDSFLGLLQKLGGRFPSFVDVLESDEEVLLLIELPGCNPSDIDLTLKRDTLHLEATRKETHPGYIALVESRPKRYDYKLPLPWNVSSRGASATYEDGLLRVKLSKVDLDRDDVVIDTSSTGLPVNKPGGTETSSGIQVESRDELESLSYRDLQSIAVDLGVKGNLPRDELETGIAEELDL